MKKFLAVIVGIIIFRLGFYLQHLFVDYVMSLFPTSVSEWYGIINLSLYVLTFGITLSISIICSFIAIFLIIEN